MKRVFAIDVLVCPHCGGPRKLIALLTAQAAIVIVYLLTSGDDDPGTVDDGLPPSTR